MTKINSNRDESLLKKRKEVSSPLCSRTISKVIIASSTLRGVLCLMSPRVFPPLGLLVSYLNKDHALFTSVLLTRITGSGSMLMSI